MYGSETPQDKDIYDFKKMSSADLKSILREDLNSTEADRLSVEEIKIIVRLLKEREEDELNTELTNTNIKGKIPAPEENYRVKPKAVFTRKRIFVRTIAAVVSIFLLGTITVFACEIDIVSIFKSWTGELFRVNYSGEISSSTNIQDGSTNNIALESCNSANEVLSALGVTQPLLPSWCPEEYSLLEFQVNVHSDRTTIYEYHQSTDLDKGFSIQINLYNQLPENEASWYQKDSTQVEIFTINGVSHYIMSNLGDYTAVWTIENYECSISGNISVETLKKMIESIYN